MLVIFFLFWLILNSRVTLEIVIFGIVIAAGMYAFVCIFTDYSPKKDLLILKKLPLFIAYIFILIIEIIKANIAMAGYIFRPQIIAEPEIIVFTTDLKSNSARVLLANSITMTPGTITLELKDGNFCVHCYDKSMGEGIDESIFVRMLRRIEK